jgi:2-iminobutanoate/2-iminopropanoate deaminase
MSTTFLNPAAFGDYTPFGLSLGAASGRLVFAAGMAFDVETMQRSEDADSIAAEARMCVEEVETLVGEAGCTLRDVVKLSCYVADASYEPEVRRVWAEASGAGTPPAYASYVVGRAGDCRVELDAVAVRPSGG